MIQDQKLKLFISYSHKDESYVEEFKKHIAPLEEKGLMEIWYDRKILPGRDFQSEINNNLEKADIICLLISVNFLVSEACKEEKNKALKLHKMNGIPVIPIILSPCGWLDYEDISKLLALPTDGKPVSSFSNRDAAWQDVYNELRKIIYKEMKIKQLKIKEEFEKFLQDVEILTSAHSQKETVILDDIFVYPELDKFDNTKENEETINAKELLEKFSEYSRIIIAGENQSGKTTLCKKFFKELKDRNFIPVYISAAKSCLSGKMEHKILHSLCQQYEGIDINEIDKERIIPIIDDFHLFKNNEKYIKDLSSYPRYIIIVDDIFSLNVEDGKLIGSFVYFRIKEFKPSLRYELIKKWVSITNNNSIDYEAIDSKVELINSTLGKTLGEGIMPAFPFFILSAVVAYETFGMSINQGITSQGYCYQALVYFYLMKQDVKADEIDIYINFLTELAFYIYKEKKYELTPDDFNSFMQLYLGKYNLPIKQEDLFDNLNYIISRDSFNNFSFRYPYLYYFFVAKYLAEHLEDHIIKKEIEKVINNLHVDENAYIGVFLTHHSKNDDILDELLINTLCLFDEYKAATLTKEEVKFFDDQADVIVKAVLPPSSTTPEKERIERLKLEDKLENSKKDIEKMDEKEDSLKKDLRKAIKTVEVIGCIIKNRAGSLEKTKLEEILEEAINVHLRILSSFFNIIKKEGEQEDIIDFISNRLEKIIEERTKINKKISEEELKKLARIIFWNLNFFMVYSIIFKIVHSLGSNKLTDVVNKVCDKINTPAAFLVKQGILMWYNKNLRINEIAERINKRDFSIIAENTMKLMVVNYCSLHPVNYKDRQRIESKLRIPAKKLLKISNNVKNQIV